MPATAKPARYKKGMGFLHSARRSSSQRIQGVMGRMLLSRQSTLSRIPVSTSAFTLTNSSGSFSFNARVAWHSV